MADTAPPAPPADPIVDRSLAPHFLASVIILLGTVAWAVFDETFTRRPYKDIQAAFVEAATLKSISEVPPLRERVAEEKQSEAYQEAVARLAEALEDVSVVHDALPPELLDELKLTGELKKDLDLLGEARTKVEGDLSNVRGQYQVLRGDYQPHVYEYERALFFKEEQNAARKLDQVKAAEPEINKVFREFMALTDRKAAIQRGLDAYNQNVSAARRAVALAVPSQEKLDGALQNARGMSWSTEIAQVFNEELGVVDRCHSCHVATERMGYDKESWDAAASVVDEWAGKGTTAYAKRVFTTHPNLGTDDPAKFDAFANHPIEMFGCTTCHLGNGPATVADKAHGLEGDPKSSWLKPRHYELNPMLPTDSTHLGSMFEASCVKCHDQQLYLKGAEQLTLGRELMEDVGCVGCHKVQGFRLEEQEIEDLTNTLDKELKPKLLALAGQLEETEEPARVKRALLEVGNQVKVAERRLAELDSEYKFIGPDLNRAGDGGLKNKIFPQWLPRWISNPHAFRPGTRMPNALLARNADPAKDEVIQVAAYIWQQAKGTPAAAGAVQPSFPDAVVQEGRWLANTVGCIGCHSLSDDDGGYDAIDHLRPAEIDATPKAFAAYDVKIFWASQDGILKTGDNEVKPERRPYVRRGESFGPSLGRIGEKVRYDWLVKWLLDPKSIQPHSSMPSLRLTQDEAGKIAAFLTTLRSTKAGGESFAEFDVKLLDDPKLATKGYRHIVRNGCYNCHEIDLRVPAVPEAELAADPAKAQSPFATWQPVAVQPGKIGIELSAHGSKPLPQFDFGVYHHDVPHYRPAWLQTKLLEPRYWDAGKYKGNPGERLIMPRFGLDRDEARAITTVLVGLVEDEVPGQYLYRPDARGQAIVRGERLLKKYNCRSCHMIDGRGAWGHEAIEAGVSAAFGDVAMTKQQLKSTQGIETPLASKQYLPPPLTGQGTRTRPEWLFHFFKNPGAVETAGKIRPFHLVRMPTFELTDSEAQALVDYFNALEQELDPYPTNPEPSPELVEEGRKLFARNECHKCHSVGSWRSEQFVGPNFQITRNRNRVDWLHQFLPDPQTYVPGSQMVSFWNEVPYFVLSKKEQREVDAISAYTRKLADPSFREAEGFVRGARPKVLDMK